MDIICKLVAAGYLAVVAYSAMGEIFGWEGYRSVVGQQCGQDHHWVYVRSGGLDAELSCERDR